ncbi:GABA transporter 1 [Chlorella vulgaris]
MHGLYRRRRCSRLVLQEPLQLSPYTARTLHHGVPETRCDASELDVSGKSHGKGYTGPEGYTGTDMEKETSGEYQASWLLNQPVISITEHLNTAASRSQAMSCSNPLIIHLQAKESFRTDIGKGTWLYAGYHLATTIATPAAYAYLPFAFAGLGWGPGMVALVMGIAVTWYASVLLSSLHEWNGVRYVRYRDVATSISGKWAGYSVVAFQQIASLGNNITLGIVAGVSMKALNQSFNPGSSITLQEFIIIFGSIQLVLSQFPTIHDLRLLNMVCTICTMGFAITATVLSVYAGYNRAPGSDPVSYTVLGDPTAKAFGIFAALGTATLREPIKGNMYKSVALCYSVISAGYLMVTIAGYWAFGNAVNPYLPLSFVGPTWAVRMSEFFALLQIVGCYQIYCRPTYEVAEDYLMDQSKSPMSLRNVLARFAVTTTYCAILTLIGCAMPFFGAFLALCGAIGFTPLDFIMPLYLYNKVHKQKMNKGVWVTHWALIVLYTLVGIVAAIGAVYFIIQFASDFSFFADIYSVLLSGGKSREMGHSHEDEEGPSPAFWHEFENEEVDATNATKVKTEKWDTVTKMKRGQPQPSASGEVIGIITGGTLSVSIAVVTANNMPMLQALQAVGLDDKATDVVSALGGNFGPTALLTFGFMKLQGLAQGNRSKQNALTLAREQLEKAEQLLHINDYFMNPNVSSAVGPTLPFGKKKRHEYQQRRRRGDGRRAASEAGPSSGHQRREARASAQPVQNMPTGLRFTASLCKAAKDTRLLLIEVDASITGREIRCSHTGGDAWCYSAAASNGSAAADVGPQKCNAWDRKGRNPAMNIYVHLASDGSTAVVGSSNGAPVEAAEGGGAGGGGGGEAGARADADAEHASSRCKLGVLVQHALPRLAQRLGAYGQVGLDWVTWQADDRGAPLPDTVASLGLVRDEQHWLQLRQLAKEKETGAGTACANPPPPDSAEEQALRRAKATLVEAARYCGAEAAARVERLTVRKLYQREYHFFDGDTDVGDSRLHALEWAAGLAAVQHLLETNPEAKAKLNERLSGPSANGGGGAAARKRQRAAGGGGGRGGKRRVVLAVAGGPSSPQVLASGDAGMPGPGPGLGTAAGEAPLAAGVVPTFSAFGSLNSSMLLPRLSAWHGSSSQLQSLFDMPPPPSPSPLQQPPQQEQQHGSPEGRAQPGAAAGAQAEAASVQPVSPAAPPPLQFSDWLAQLQTSEPTVLATSVLQPLPAELPLDAAPAPHTQHQPEDQQLPQQQQQQRIADQQAFAEELQPQQQRWQQQQAQQQQHWPEQQQQQQALAQAPARAASVVSAARPAEQQQQPAQQPQPSCAGELVPLDAALDAWERHDHVLQELSLARSQLQQQEQQLAELLKDRERLQRQLAAAQAHLSEGPAPMLVAGAGASGGSDGPASCSQGSSPRGVLQERAAAAAAAATAAKAAQLADLQLLLPQSLQLHLSQLFSQRPELQAFAGPIGELSCRAIEQALGMYGLVAAQQASLSRLAECLMSVLLQASRAFSAAAGSGPIKRGTIVLSWGTGQQGALGTRSDSDQHEPEQIPDLPSNIVSVGAGHFSSFAVTAEGQLYSWGRNREGQLGRALGRGEFECSALPQSVDALAKHHVTAATGSGVLSFAMSRDGSLFAFGTSKRGQLGLGPDALQAHVPQQVPLPTGVQQVSAGWGHAAALLSDGTLYSWGRRRGGAAAARAAVLAASQGGAAGRLCAALTTPWCWQKTAASFPLATTRCRSWGGPGEHLRPDCASSWIVNPETECGRRIKFRRVAAGLGHCLGLLNDGSVVSWGWNSGGQLGLGQFVSDECVLKPTPIYGIPTNRHALLAAGRVHSVLATDEITDRSAAFESQGLGKAVLTMCHSWGSAANGRLGTGRFEETSYPEMLPELDGEQILELACGLDHTLALAAADQQSLASDIRKLTRKATGLLTTMNQQLQKLRDKNQRAADEAMWIRVQLAAAADQLSGAAAAGAPRPPPLLELLAPQHKSCAALPPLQECAAEAAARNRAAADGGTTAGSSSGSSSGGGLPADAAERPFDAPQPERLEEALVAADLTGELAGHSAGARAPSATGTAAAAAAAGSGGASSEASGSATDDGSSAAETNCNGAHTNGATGSSGGSSSSQGAHTSGSAAADAAVGGSEAQAGHSPTNLAAGGGSINGNGSGEGSSAAGMEVAVASSDGAECIQGVAISKDIALMSPYVLREVVQNGFGLDGNPPVMLPKQVSVASWELVQEYCAFHSERRMFDERFIRRDSGLLCDLTSAADALELRALVDLASRAIARLIEGKSADQIREAFRLPDDLTEEEKLEPIAASLGGPGDPRVRLLNRLYSKRRKELQQRKQQAAALAGAGEQAQQAQQLLLTGGSSGSGSGSGSGSAVRAAGEQVLAAQQQQQQQQQAQQQQEQDERSLDELLSFIESSNGGSSGGKGAGPKVGGGSSKSKKKKGKQQQQQQQQHALPEQGPPSTDRLDQQQQQQQQHALPEQGPPSTDRLDQQQQQQQQQQQPQQQPQQQQQQQHLEGKAQAAHDGLRAAEPAPASNSGTHDTRQAAASAGSAGAAGAAGAAAGPQQQPPQHPRVAGYALPQLPPRAKDALPASRALAASLTSGLQQQQAWTLVQQVQQAQHDLGSLQQQQQQQLEAGESAAQALPALQEIQLRLRQLLHSAEQHAPPGTEQQLLLQALGPCAETAAAPGLADESQQQQHEQQQQLLLDSMQPGAAGLAPGPLPTALPPSCSRFMMPARAASMAAVGGGPMPLSLAESTLAASSLFGELPADMFAARAALTYRPLTLLTSLASFKGASCVRHLPPQPNPSGKRPPLPPPRLSSRGAGSGGGGAASSTASTAGSSSGRSSAAASPARKPPLQPGAGGPAAGGGGAAAVPFAAALSAATPAAWLSSSEEEQDEDVSAAVATAAPSGIAAGTTATSAAPLSSAAALLAQHAPVAAARPHASADPAPPSAGHQVPQAELLPQQLPQQQQQQSCAEAAATAAVPEAAAHHGQATEASVWRLPALLRWNPAAQQRR